MRHGMKDVTGHNMRDVTGHDMTMKDVTGHEMTMKDVTGLSMIKTRKNITDFYFQIINLPCIQNQQLQL